VTWNSATRTYARWGEATQQDHRTLQLTAATANLLYRADHSASQLVATVVPSSIETSYSIVHRYNLRIRTTIPCHGFVVYLFSVPIVYRQTKKTRTHTHMQAIRTISHSVKNRWVQASPRICSPFTTPVSELTVTQRKNLFFGFHLAPYPRPGATVIQKVHFSLYVAAPHFLLGAFSMYPNSRQWPCGVSEGRANKHPGKHTGLDSELCFITQ
jgi:hypothetical protein